MLYDNLKDILRHTHDLGFIEIVKLRGENNKTYVEAITEEKTVVLYGELKNEIEELHDQTIGLSRLPVLKGYINFPPFIENGAEITISTQERMGNTIPAELSFKGVNGHNAHYRFMSAEMASEQVKVPEFNGAKWDIQMSPTAKSIKELQYLNSVLGAYEPTFSVDIKDEVLHLNIGSGPTDRSVLPFGKVDVNGTVNGSWRWTLTEVLSILKLSDNDTCKLYISNQGALKLEMDSGLGTYEYILPGRT